MNSRYKVVIYVLIFIIILSAIIFIRNEKNEYIQSNIKITPDEVMQIFKESGLNISEENPINENNPGPMGFTKNGFSFKLEQNNKDYKVCVIMADGWKNAKLGSESSNHLDEEMRGGFNFSSAFGPIIIVVYPAESISDDLSYREISKELIVILSKNYSMTNR